ncbi:acetylxylan esterase [Apiospora arundinis]|uniref:Acetylxylan esterase n=1 Tax=Apiospora arundinis TaxID=335852 RepID=A0ABR2JB05_9PEZI
MKTTTVLPILAAGLASASPIESLETRQSANCPNIFVFGARETTAPKGFGTAGGLVQQVQNAFPGTQTQAIDYPACGGQASCGGVQYDASAQQGTTAVISAVNSLNQRCPNTQIVMVGYSQGGQIMDNALCGGLGQTLTGTALAAVKVAIFMGDPHNQNGLPFNVGTCKAGGFAARPAGFQCAPYNTKLIQSYCDAADPFCCNGNDSNTHNQYVTKYGSQALAFIKSKVSASGGGAAAGGAAAGGNQAGNGAAAGGNQAGGATNSFGGGNQQAGAGAGAGGNQAGAAGNTFGGNPFGGNKQFGGFNGGRN